MPFPPDQQAFAAAVEEAKRRYPWLRNIGPMKLTQGSGLGMSESYMPFSEENPAPNNFTVQLRNPQLVNNPAQWPAALGREGMDYMVRRDPVYQDTADEFRALMTPQQLQMARNRFLRDKLVGDYTFEDFLKGAENQEFIGGYVFNMGDWKKHAGFTPDEKIILDQLKNYMWQGRKPQDLNIK